jgi:hypothetical protein
MTSQIKFVLRSEMQDFDGPTLAIDPTRLLPNIIRSWLLEGQAAVLVLDDQFMNARFRTSIRPPHRICLCTARYQQFFRVKYVRQLKGGQTD